MARNGDVMRSDRLKQVMQQIDPNFDERNAGFNRFSKFVLEAGQRGRRDGHQAGQRAVRGRSRHRGPGGARRACRPRSRTREREAESRNGRERRPWTSRAARTGTRARAARGRSRGRPRAARSSPSGRRRALARAGFPAHDPGAGRAARAGGPRGAAPADGRRCTGGRMRCSMRHASPDCCGRRTTPRSRTSGRWARTSTRSPRGAVASVPRWRRRPRPPPPRRPKPSPRSRPCPPARPSRWPSPRVLSRDNGLRFGVRFRRGSRGGLRTAEYPLIGVVQMDEPASAPAAAAAAAAGGGDGRSARPSRGVSAARRGRRRAPRRAKADKPAKAEASAPGSDAAAPAPAKRPRARTRKKAE